MKTSNTASLVYIMQQLTRMYNDLTNVYFKQDLDNYPLAQKFLKCQIERIENALSHIDTVLKQEKVDINNDNK